MVLINNKHESFKVVHVRGGGTKKTHVGGGPFVDGIINSLPITKIKDFVLQNGINFALNKLPLPELHLMDGTRKYNFCG